MAIFIADPSKGMNFDSLDFSDLVGNVLVTQSPNTWQTRFGVIGNNEIVFHGVGLTYTGGTPTGGTFNEILRYESGGLTYSISGFSVTAAAFQAYRAAADIQGFFSAIFAGNDNLTGSSQDDLLRGYGGNDNMSGGGGSDILLGGTGNDVVNGGSATDLLVGEAGNDTLDGGSGDDWLDGGAGNDTYYINSSGELITESLAGAAGGTDRVYSSTNDFKLSSNLEQLYLTGNGDIKGTGNTLNNTIVGNDGDNRLDGATGIDTMTGGKGDDLYFVDQTKDVVTEGVDAGFDTVQSSASYAIGNNIEQLVLIGSADINGNGNALNNYIQGNSGDNFLNGGNGTDSIWALDGNDTINGGLQNDIVAGNGGDDLITVYDGNDTVLYTSILDGHDLINNFDGNAAGGQDVLNLDGFFDELGVTTANRAGLITINDKGASVDVEFQFFGTTVLATINTPDAVTLGTDVIVGTL